MTGEKVALLLGAEGPGLTEHAMRATDVRADSHGSRHGFAERGHRCGDGVLRAGAAPAMSQARGPAPTPWATGLTLTAFSFVATVITVVACGRCSAGSIRPSPSSSMS